MTTVFRYDGSFEGLLTAVFDGYARRAFPDALLSAGEPAPLFTDHDHTVATDSAKAARVWAGLERRLPREVTNMMAMGWLSEEPGVDIMLARYMRRVLDTPEGEGTGGGRGAGGSAAGGDPYTPAKRRGYSDGGGKGGSAAGGRRRDTPGGVETDFSDPDILRVRQLAQKVSREREHIVQFTRFQKGRQELPATEGDPTGATWFAPVAPCYNVLPLAVGYFSDRFRDQRWLVYDIRRHFGYYYDLKDVTEVTMEEDDHLAGGELPAELLAENEELFQRMWQGYIASMAIAERINPRLQRQHMPRRFWPLLTEMRKQ